jgi:catechol 2,3-dioxygenase-like lactoylglutathione lyase family enzyme
MAVKFDSIVLMVSDLERSIEFYRDKLSMPVRYSSKGFVTLEAGPVPFQLEALSEATKTFGPEALLVDHAAGHRVAFTVHVEDVDTAYRDLKDKGVNFIKPPTNMPWGHRNADFADPDGNIWVLYEPLETQRKRLH